MHGTITSIAIPLHLFHIRGLTGLISNQVTRMTYFIRTLPDWQSPPSCHSDMMWAEFTWLLLCSPPRPACAVLVEACSCWTDGMTGGRAADHHTASCWAYAAMVDGALQSAEPLKRPSTPPMGRMHQALSRLYGLVRVECRICSIQQMGSWGLCREAADGFSFLQQGPFF